MEEVEIQFREISKEHVNRMVDRSVDKYFPTDKRSRAEISDSLSRLFWQENFELRIATFFEIYTVSAPDKYRNYLSVSIANYLKQFKDEEFKQERNSLYDKTLKALREEIRNLAEENVIETDPKMPDKPSDTFGKTDSKKGKNSPPITRSRNKKKVISSTVADEELLETFKKMDGEDSGSVFKVAKRYGPKAKYAGEIYFDHENFKNFLKDLHGRIDGWIVTKRLCLVLQKYHHLLHDPSMTSFEIGAGEEDDGKAGEPVGVIPIVDPPPTPHDLVEQRQREIFTKATLPVCYKWLEKQVRKNRIYQLKTGENKKPTNQEISDILRNEGLGCDQSTVSRDWREIRTFFKEVMNQDDWNEILDYLEVCSAQCKKPKLDDLTPEDWMAIKNLAKFCAAGCKR